MDILKKISADPVLAHKIMLKCDFEIYHDFQEPESVENTVWNMDSKAFGADASGGEFVLLSDGSIGFNSSEGETGRIAEDIKEFFSLIVNCPCFMAFLVKELYQDETFLGKYAQAVENQYREDFNSLLEGDWDSLKKEISEALEIELDLALHNHTLKKFYQAATREPRYQYVFTDDDGSEIKSEPLISRPFRDWMKEMVKE